MLNFNDIALVWGENESTNNPAKSPSVSVSLWSEIIGSEWNRWDTSDICNVPDTVRTCKVALVNLFHTADSIHIEQIRQVNLSCYILACPDPSLDLVLSNPSWMNMYKQMQLADAVGGRTHADCDVYGTLLNKPTYYFPSPIGLTEWFLPYRELPKSDYLLTLDHAFAPANTVCNVAAVAAIQRKTGLRVLYAAEREWTKEYAQLAELECEWLGCVPFTEMVDLTARAKLCVDIYSSHSYGRQQVVCGMVGTPIIASEWCEDAPGYHVNPFHPEREMNYALNYLNDPVNYQDAREQGYRWVDNAFSFDASDARLRMLLRQIEAERIKGEVA